MIRVYISPRYEPGPNRTRNVIAQIITSANGYYDEVANLSKKFGICFAHTDQETHDAIIADGRAKPISPLYVDEAAYSIGLETDFDTLPAKAEFKANLEAFGINAGWILPGVNLRTVIRYAIKPCVVMAFLEREAKQDVLTFLKNSLDSTVADVPQAVRTAVRDWMQARGLATGWIKTTSTVREVIHFIAENLSFRSWKIGQETF